MIIGVWIASGTVPTLIYYGLTILSPQIFLAAAMVLCSNVSLSLGTPWGTVGTVGLALMGIGAGFGIPEYWTAGAGGGWEKGRVGKGGVRRVRSRWSPEN